METQISSQFRSKLPFHKADLELFQKALIPQQIICILNASQQLV